MKVAPFKALLLEATSLQATEEEEAAEEAATTAEASLQMTTQLLQSQQVLQLRQDKALNPCQQTVEVAGTRLISCEYQP